MIKNHVENSMRRLVIVLKTKMKRAGAALREENRKIRAFAFAAGLAGM
ncbi:MAG: hypothetical protein ACLTK0_10180 [Anaerovoracaceae bacterium]